MTADQEYENALKVIKQYREERGMDFYLPINIDSAEGTITVEELGRYESSRTGKPDVDDKTWQEWFAIIKKIGFLPPQKPPSVQEMLAQDSEKQLLKTKKRLGKK